MCVRHVTREWGRRGREKKTRVRITCLRVSFCVQVGMRLSVQIRICAYSQKLSAAIRNVYRERSRNRVRCCRAVATRCCCCCCCCCCCLRFRKGVLEGCQTLGWGRVRCCRAAPSRYFCCCCCCCLRLLSVSICTFVLVKQVISAPLAAWRQAGPAQRPPPRLVYLLYLHPCPAHLGALLALEAGSSKARLFEQKASKAAACLTPYPAADLPPAYRPLVLAQAVRCPEVAFPDLFLHLLARPVPCPLGLLLARSSSGVSICTFVLVKQVT